MTVLPIAHIFSLVPSVESVHDESMPAILSTVVVVCEYTHRVVSTYRFVVLE